MKKNKLPDVPSVLIKAAVKDTKLAEKSQKYEVDMGKWHEPNGKCSICFAGSVMAFTLNTHASNNLKPEDFDLDTCNKLLALDEFRTGYIEYGLIEMGLVLKDGMEDWMKVCPYWKDKTKFYKDMKKVVKELEKYGL